VVFSEKSTPKNILDLARGYPRAYSTLMNTTQNKLETMTCSRCGGSGHYSFCQMYGTKCFKCHGSGVAYTARGMAARAHLEALRSKPAGELVPGDIVRFRGVPGISRDVWATIASVRCPSELKAWIAGEPVDTTDLVDYVATETVKGTSCAMTGLNRAELVRVFQTPEQTASTLARAVEYQATLTKAGTPRKRTAKRAA